MTIFLDKEFVRNFWSVSWSKDAVLEHFKTQFLLNTNNAIIFTNYSSLEEIAENEEDTFFLEVLFEDVPDMEYNINFSDKDVLIEQSNKGGFNIFFIEQDDRSNGQLESELGYEFISSNTINEKWGRHYKNRSIVKTTSLFPNDNDPDILNSWKDLKFLSEVPNNSIILIDKYILSDNYNNRLKDNLFPLLESILPNKLNSPLYLTIISKEILSSRYHIPIIERVERVYQQIHSFLAKYKHLEVVLTIINNDNSFYPKGMELHDRLIYTNYYYLMSSKGWDIFNKNGRRIGNSRVNIEFNFQRFQMKELRGHFKIIKEYLKELRNSNVNSTVFKHYPAEIHNPLLN